MAEIPVEHKKGTPGWLWGLGALLLLAIVAAAVLAMRHSGDAGVAQRSGAATTVVCTSEAQCGDRQLCVNGFCAAVSAAACATAEVHFDTDSATLQAGDQARIGRMARCLKADQSLKLTIAGSADPRGTAEHNADLAQQRAMAVSRALQAQGVSPQQLKVVSYGDNYSLCGESDAQCWAKNRQASLTPTPAQPGNQQ